MRAGENVKKVRRGVEKLPEENSIKGNMGRRRIMRKILQRQWQQHQQQQQPNSNISKPTRVSCHIVWGSEARTPARQPVRSSFCFPVWKH